MRYMPSLVTVRDIQPRTARAEHPSEAIEALARHILASGALARPLLVRQTGPDRFELLNGELAYHAAARAREIDPSQAEAVLAFLANQENEAELLQQLERLHGHHGGPAPAGAGDVGAALARLEQLVTQGFGHLEARQRQEQEALRQTTEVLQRRLPRPIPVLELLNGADDEALRRHLAETGCRGAECVLFEIQAARHDAPFRTVEDAVKRAKGLTALRALKLLDACEGHVALPAADAPIATDDQPMPRLRTTMI